MMKRLSHQTVIWLIYGVIVFYFIYTILSNTIHGLIEQIQSEFPWYKELNKMLHTSPLFIKDTSTHGDSAIDLTVLGPMVRRSGKKRKVVEVENSDSDNESGVEFDNTPQKAIVSWMSVLCSEDNLAARQG